MERQDFVWDREYGVRGTVWSRRKKDMPDFLEGKMVLEVGVGNGKTLWSILEQKPEWVVAFDFSSEGLRRCRTSFDSCGNVSFSRADLTCMPFRDGVFDVVVLYYVLDNLLETGRVKAVGEACRVLKKRGKLLFEDFAVGDFRESTSKGIDVPEHHTLLKKKGLICHYFTREEVLLLFADFAKREIALKTRTPIRNKNHLVRKTLSGVMEK